MAETNAGDSMGVVTEVSIRGADDNDISDIDNALSIATPIFHLRQK